MRSWPRSDAAITAGSNGATALQITAVAHEREEKLRQALETTGMLRSAYWASWMTFETVMGLETTLLLCALGAAWQVRSFPVTGRAVQLRC